MCHVIDIGLHNIGLEYVSCQLHVNATLIDCKIISL